MTAKKVHALAHIFVACVGLALNLHTRLASHDFVDFIFKLAIESCLLASMIEVNERMKPTEMEMRYAKR